MRPGTGFPVEDADIIDFYVPVLDAKIPSSPYPGVHVAKRHGGFPSKPARIGTLSGRKRERIDRPVGFALHRRLQKGALPLKALPCH